MGRPRSQARGEGEVVVRAGGSDSSDVALTFEDRQCNRQHAQAESGVDRPNVRGSLDVRA